MTIEQIDVYRCEDGRTIMATGYLADSDDVVICCFTDEVAGEPFAELAQDEEEKWRAMAACTLRPQGRDRSAGLGWGGSLRFRTVCRTAGAGTLC